MRIVNIMLGGKHGGLEQAVVDYACALAAMGHSSEAIVRHDASMFPRLHEARIPTHTLRMPQNWNPLAHARLNRLLRRYDMAILHGNRAAILARHASAATPLVAVAHSRFFTPYPEFEAIITPSPRMAEHLRLHAGCPIHLVPNMIEIPAAAPRQAWRNPPVIGVLGRFDPVKGIDLFIDALAILHQRGIPCRARIGGDGALRGELQRYALTRGVAHSIEWLGWVKDKSAFFEKIDLFCLPSRSETFPITLLEALAHGVPSIATDCGGPSAILTEHSGLLAAVSASGIADALAHALTHQESATAMGEAGRTHVAEQFAIPVVTRRLHETVMNIAAHPAPVFNLMFGRLRGGLEQAAVDYAEALTHGGVAHTTLLSPDAAIASTLKAREEPIIHLGNYGWWDWLAIIRLRRLVRRRRARALICHGNRALSLARRAAHHLAPVIAVAHNYRTTQFLAADACLAITAHAKHHLIADGVPAGRIHFMPNMVRLPEQLHVVTPATPPVIGTFGRLIARKGFQDWLEALALLRNRGVAFTARLGGDGEDYAELAQQVETLGLTSHVTLTGWVDAGRFLRELDLFVLPSRHEPFGIALIEAMAHGVPSIATAVEGPREIITHEQEGLLVPAQDPAAMADAMQRLLADPALSRHLADAAYRRVAQEYTLNAMADRLKTALYGIISAYHG